MLLSNWRDLQHHPQCPSLYPNRLPVCCGPGKAVLPQEERCLSQGHSILERQDKGKGTAQGECATCFQTPCGPDIVTGSWAALCSPRTVRPLRGLGTLAVPPGEDLPEIDCLLLGNSVREPSSRAVVYAERKDGIQYAGLPGDQWDCAPPQ